MRQATAAHALLLGGSPRVGAALVKGKDSTPGAEEREPGLGAPLAPSPTRRGPAWGQGRPFRVLVPTRGTCVGRRLLPALCRHNCPRTRPLNYPGPCHPQAGDTPTPIVFSSSEQIEAAPLLKPAAQILAQNSRQIRTKPGAGGARPRVPHQRTGWGECKWPRALDRGSWVRRPIACDSICHPEQTFTFMLNSLVSICSFS